MLISLVLALMVGLMLIGMPIAIAMGIATIAYLGIADISLSILPQRMTNAVNSFLILAIPLFYLAGELMNACRLTERIVALSKALVGHFRGGLAQVSIVSGMIFAGISGSATAETAALGSVLIPVCSSTPAIHWLPFSTVAIELSSLPAHSLFLLFEYIT